jgi:hypothetical protein
VSYLRNKKCLLLQKLVFELYTVGVTGNKEGKPVTACWNHASFFLFIFRGNSLFAFSLKNAVYEQLSHSLMHNPEGNKELVSSE